VKVLPHPILFGSQNQEEWNWLGLYHVWVRGKVHTGFWWRNLMERNHLEDLDVDDRILQNGSSRNGMGT